MFSANSTRAFEGVQTVAVGVVLLSVVGTVALYYLGLPVERVGVVFIGLFALLMVLAWPLFARFQPRHGRADSE